jgi:hypothetical protein
MAEVDVTAQKLDLHVVKSTCSWSYMMTMLINAGHQQQERRLLYLKKMKEFYFNCLTRDHKVASYHDPTRC